MHDLLVLPEGVQAAVETLATEFFHASSTVHLQLSPELISLDEIQPYWYPNDGSIRGGDRPTTSKDDGE